MEEVGNYLTYTTADGGSKWKELISILRSGSGGSGSGGSGSGGNVTTGVPTADIICILQPNNANNSDFCVMELKEKIVKECAEMFSIPICDCCFDFYSPSNTTELTKYWRDDKLHLSDDGHQALIDKLETTLNTLPYYKSS